MMTKRDIRKAVARFRADTTRIFSEASFSELAGIDIKTFRNIFVDGENMSRATQIRVEKALMHLAKGNVALMKHGHEKRVEYRREAKPEFARGYGIQFKDGALKIKIGPRNLNDYSSPTLKDQMEKG